MSEPQTKGSSISGSREWIDARLGEGWFMRTARQHEPSWPEELASNGWYAVRVELWALRRAYEALAGVEGFESFEDMMARISADMARTDLRGMLRAFLWVVSPTMFLASAPKLWANYADFTAIEVVRNEPGVFVAKITEIPEDLMSYVVGVWTGFPIPALELAGGKDPNARIVERRATPGTEAWELVVELTYG